MTETQKTLAKWKCPNGCEKDMYILTETENARLREAVEAEREACARIADSFIRDLAFSGEHTTNLAAELIAETIRARSEKAV